MGCCRMLGTEDRAAIMVGMNSGLSQVRTAHWVGGRRGGGAGGPPRHTGPDRVYRAEAAGQASP